ncbi:flagellar protein FlaG [Cupriavidus basilensis]|uniref:flagellar protein FlaG n=1 Tax=Cupriavidus basilensis TaxID=68895 RepID=UPI00283B9BFE|nr:flagellar protein FlaG [Cupriavidus basilensis]MDR3384294.1 flagellar protein FlaG [Cupriavidus basilensis]
MISSTEPLLPMTATQSASPLPSVTAAGTAATTAASGSDATGPKPANGSHAAASGELDSALKGINDALQATSLEVRVGIDKTTHRLVTSVVDKTTGETIRQFPSKEVLRMIRAIDKLQGLLIHQTA